MDNPGVCTAFLTWGFTDKYTWLGSGKFPLPYDYNYKQKQAYHSMMSMLKNHSKESETSPADEVWLQ